MGASELIVLFITYGTMLVMAGVIAYVLGSQTRRRGYGWVSWIVFSLLARNPIYPILLLALLPNKARIRQREQFAAELDAKLAATRPSSAAVTMDFPSHSVGNLPTHTPGS